LIWRPALQDGTGLRLRHRPTVRGPQTAIVVGPKGQTSPDGADEIFTDAMGRIRVRFHWQSVAASSTEPCGADAFDSCWVRVLQRLSGPGMGHQFIPRIGQEVLVGFLGNDIDRPVVIGSLHNGQGESGIAPTPGGTVGTSATSGTAAEAQTIAKSTDHQPSGQMNLIGEGTGGHSPAWHGGAPGAATEGNPGQANAAALSGIKSKEFGGDGHNQLVLDDTPQQLRARLHTTQAQTWLEMGHLLHQADNHRGSLRGQGLELRTDAWGGLRAARGLLLSTYSLRGAAGAGLGTSPEPASDNAAGIALARQMQQLNQAFQQATRTHQTVGLATGVQASTTLSQSLRGSGVNGAAVPHMSDPHIALAGKAGVGLTVGQDVHLSSQGATTLASGQDSHWAVGGQARIHTGQAIGVLAGAVQAGSDAAGNGLTVIAAQGAVDLQAHAGAAQIAAQGAMELKTAHGAVNMAAAKKVTLAVSGGASLTIEGGSFTAQCPGKITVKAGVKSMVGPDQINRVFPDLPSDKLFAASYAVHDNNNRPVIGQRYLMTLPNGEVQLGRTNIEGETPTVYSNSPQLLELTLLDGDEWHQMEINSAHHESDKYWGNQK
jgi:type VI secretion system secreted protein VgrG